MDELMMIVRDRKIGLVLWLALILGGCSTARAPEPVVAKPAPVSAAEDLRTSLYWSDLGEAARTLGTTVGDTRPFTLEMPIPDHGSVEAAVSYFAGARRETIQGSLHRSGPWIPMIHEVLSSYGLPPDLAYLPVIESGYRITLTSSAGAHGMWQFMPPTAREYGLRVDWWVDERADPWKATRAAAHYLSDLYRMFGDWPLALAAYNCGPGRVRRTLEKEEATTFWELLDKKALPKETRGYVPTFYATIVLAGTPEQYAFELPPTSEVTYEEVSVRGPFSLGFLAKSTGVEEDEIRKLNAELHQGLVPPGAWKLRVPSGTARVIASREWYLEDSSVRLASYSTRRGDDLRSLARKLGVALEEIKSINGIRGDNASPGTLLWLPIHQSELTARLNHIPAPDTWHTVSAGETLYSIARGNGLTVEELVDLNQIRTDHVIHPGDRLLVRPNAVATGGM